MAPFLKMDSETSESNSTSLAEDAMNISFEDISYSVADGLLTKVLRRRPKAILRGLSGSFNAGELTVIMGQSGAGKSSLMGIIAGYTKHTSGKIFINKSLRNEERFRRRSSYILQDANMWDMFTVQESLNFAAEFKLGNHVTSVQKENRVEEVIKSLDLHEKRQTKVCDLSGGQKKRLSIGLELISDSLVMFLDEPTSGLDSSMSRQIVSLLRLLARQGRTIVATIHQPSAALLHMVDRLYVIEGGRCAYTGSVPNLLPYMQTMNFKCPTYYSPIDYLIQLCTEHPNKLVESSENGKKIWDTNKHQLNYQEIEVTSNNGYIDHNSNDKCNNLHISLLPPPTEDPTSKVIRALKSTYPTSFLKQFSTLTKRNFLTIRRDPKFTITITSIHCAMALGIGLLYFNIGVAAEDVMDNFKFLNFSALFLMFTAFSAVTINFPAQIPVARREHFNRWYTSDAYYASTLVSSLVTQTVCTLSYAILAYVMTGQPYEWYRSFLFIVMLLLVSYVALCVGLFNGVIFNVKNGVVFGPLLNMPFIMFSGLFIIYPDAPSYFKWMFQTSYMKHGVTGLVLAIFDGREKLMCSPDADYCQYKYPKTFINYLGMTHESFSVAISAMLATAAIIIVFSFVILKLRLMGKW